MRTLPHNVMTHGPTTRSTLTIRAVHRCPLRGRHYGQVPVGRKRDNAVDFAVDGPLELWATAALMRHLIRPLIRPHIGAVTAGHERISSHGWKIVDAASTT